MLEAHASLRKAARYAICCALIALLSISQLILGTRKA